MIEKTVEIDGKMVSFRSSAAIPRLYRIKFGRDVMIDIKRMHNAYGANKSKGKEFEKMDLELFENLAYIMARHADDAVGADIEKWLEQFETFSIYQVLPEILSLWSKNQATTIESKKKLKKVAGGN